MQLQKMGLQFSDCHLQSLSTYPANSVVQKHRLYIMPASYIQMHYHGLILSRKQSL